MADSSAQIWNFPNSKIVIEDPPRAAGKVTPAWSDWFQQVTTICFAGTLSGITAARPKLRVLASDPPSANLWTGRVYYDTDLHKPIWWDPDPGTPDDPATQWRDATGAFV